MKTKMRKVIVNDTLYEITEKVYQRLYPKLGKRIKVLSEKQHKKLHQNRCDLIREKGEIIDEIDLMLRDD